MFRWECCFAQVRICCSCWLVLFSITLFYNPLLGVKWSWAQSFLFNWTELLSLISTEKTGAFSELFTSILWGISLFKWALKIPVLQNSISLVYLSLTLNHSPSLSFFLIFALILSLNLSAFLCLHVFLSLFNLIPSGMSMFYLFFGKMLYKVNFCVINFSNTLLI